MPVGDVLADRARNRPAVFGKAISELVLHGRCRFADLGAIRLSRFADAPPDWRERLGWLGASDPALAAPTR